MRWLIVVVLMAVSGCSLLLSEAEGGDGDGDGDGDAGPDDCRGEWAQAADGVSNDTDIVTAVAVDGCETLVCGSFIGNLVLDEEDDSFTLQQIAQADVFLARYAADGSLLWTKAIGGPGDDTCEAIVVDDEGGIYIGGTFDMRINFVEDEKSGVNLADIYFAKLSAGGVTQWSRVIASSGVDRLGALALAQNGNLMVGGHTRNTPEPQDGETYTGSLDSGAFLATLSSEGAHVTARTYGGNTPDAPGFARAIAVAANGDLIVGGDLASQIQFDDTNCPSFPAPVGTPSSFVARLSPDGQDCRWLRLIEGLEDVEELEAIAIDPTTQRIYAVGHTGSTTLNLGGGLEPGVSNGGIDGFVAELTAQGAEMSIALLGGAGDDRLVGVDFDDTGTQFLYGDFTGPFVVEGMDTGIPDGDVDLVLLSRGPTPGVLRIGGDNNDEATAFVASGTRFVIGGGVRSTFDFAGDAIMAGEFNQDLFVSSFE